MLTDNDERMTIRIGSEARARVRDAARREGNPQATVVRRALLLGLAEIERHLTAQQAALTKSASS